MILDSIRHAERYYALHPQFRTLFEYVQSHDLSSAPSGRITLEGDELFINVNDATLVPRDSQKLEVHRHYIDVHFPLSGQEECGWTPTDELGESDAPFNTEGDYAVYTQPAKTYLSAHPGDFYIVWPEDAHAPAIGEGPLRKLVAKVLIK